jgi:hypothetical protein
MGVELKVRHTLKVREKQVLRGRIFESNRSRRKHALRSFLLIMNGDHNEGDEM